MSTPKTALPALLKPVARFANAAHTTKDRSYAISTSLCCTKNVRYWRVEARIFKETLWVGSMH
ncbi:hypothetical protein ACSBR2_012130 [Camellia fascicularis]